MIDAKGVNLKLYSLVDIIRSVSCWCTTMLGIVSLARVRDSNTVTVIVRSQLSKSKSESIAMK